MILYNILLPAQLAHVLRTAALMVLLVVAVLLAPAGVSLPWCIVLVACVPAAVIVGDEIFGVRDRARRQAAEA